MSAPVAIDLFAGAGGATQGLKDAGFRVLAAIENDPVAVRTFKANHPECRVFDTNITRVTGRAVRAHLVGQGTAFPDLLTACPPCQPYSTLGESLPADQPRDLVVEIGRFVHTLRPRAILMENVPGLIGKPCLEALERRLSRQYAVKIYTIDAAGFGVPQRRRRMILAGVAHREGKVLPPSLTESVPDEFDISLSTAGDALALVAATDPIKDPVHRSRTLTSKSLARIQATKQGGGRLDLPPALQLECHRRLKGKHATSIYGRIDPAVPAPTMTTRCTTPSCGRFAHPTEDRGLTLREAATLQTFPTDYAFRGTYGQVERQIGNAVPPRLAEALGRSLHCILVRD